MTSLFSPILVPYDGSGYARAAADFAARLEPARLVLALVVPAGGDESFAEADQQQAEVEEGRRILAAGAARLSVPVEVRAIEGRPDVTLALEAESLDAGLVVIGARGRAPTRGTLLGSVARHLLTHLHRPVAITHGATTIRRVLVALDGGPRTGRIYEVAQEIARAAGAELSLVTVIEGDLDVVPAPATSGIPLAMWTAMVKDQQARAFGGLDGRTRAAASTRMGIAIDGIREEARERDADVVVVGRTGAEGVPPSGWFSVAYAIAAVGPWTTVVV